MKQIKKLERKQTKLIGEMKVVRTKLTVCNRSLGQQRRHANCNPFSKRIILDAALASERPFTTRSLARSIVGDDVKITSYHISTVSISLKQLVDNGTFKRVAINAADTRNNAALLYIKV